MTLSSDDVLQELRTVRQSDSADSLLVLGAVAPGRAQAGSGVRSSVTRRRHASTPPRGGIFGGSVSSERKYTLPHILGSPLYGAVAILILILALSASLTLLLIQAVRISHLDADETGTAASSLHVKESSQTHAHTQSQTRESGQAQTKEKTQLQTREQTHEQAGEQAQQAGTSSTSTSASPSAPGLTARQDSVQGAGSGTAPQAVQGADAPAAVSAQSSGVNVNTASKEELEKIPGVGPVTAQRILDYRTAHGAFSSVEQLTRVSGIGSKTLEKMRNHVRVQ